MIRRRNLAREAGYLLRGRNPAPRDYAAELGRAVQRVRLVQAICRVTGADPTLATGTDEARRAAVILIWDEQLKKAQPFWLFGKPSRADLTVLERRVAELLGLTHEEVVEALKGHPRPATTG